MHPCRRCDEARPHWHRHVVFPLLTTKRVNFPAIAHELLWFIAGETNVRCLHERNAHIWDQWADADGELGPVYGKQWRSWPTANGGSVDQLADVVDAIKRDPDSRRHIVSAWNVADLDAMALPPCHCLFQFYVAKGRLSCQLYQRSADVFIGVPFNIASYALLTMMVAQATGLELGELVHTLGDAHLYRDHFAQARQLLEREPRPLPSTQPGDRRPLQVRGRGHRARRLRAASGHQGAGRGLNTEIHE